MRTIRALALATLLPGVLAAALAGCGAAEPAAPGGGSGGGAAAAATDDLARGREFAACMRRNGVDVPDPQPGDGLVRIDGRVDQSALAAASEACRDLAPGLSGPSGGAPDPADLERSREFAACMRENGLPDFPDPGPDGSVQIRIGAGGPNPDDPAFRKAEEACRELAPAIGGR